MAERDTGEDECASCRHTKIRHPYGGKCNRAACGCNRFRAPGISSAPAPPPLAAPEPPPPPTPPSGEGVPDPVSDPGSVAQPEDPTPDSAPEGPQEPDELGGRMRLLRESLGSPYQAVRAQAVKIVKCFEELEELAANIATRKQLEDELAEIEARADELRQQLGIRTKATARRTR